MPIILAVGLNTQLVSLLIVGFVVMLLGLLLKRMGQPIIVAYILAGVIVGPAGLEVITDRNTINILGDLGLILLLFFIGMEISISGLLSLWRTALFGTLIQVAASVLAVAAISYFTSWDLHAVVVLGFVLSLSSTAVIIKLLDERNEAHSMIGRNVISILLMQDILLVPMLIATRFIGGVKPEVSEMIMQLVATVIIGLLLFWVLRKKRIRLPYTDRIEKDHELQVFVAVLFCFGLAAITAFAGLSAALGAFLAGILVRAADTREWFHSNLHAFRVSFVSMFFVSVGLMIDVPFLVNNWIIVSVLVLLVFILNNFINSMILYYFCRNRSNSIYGGALLAQVGELSFIITATAYQFRVIEEFTFKLAILTISFSLLLSPFWIAIIKKIVLKGITGDCAVKGMTPFDK